MYTSLDFKVSIKNLNFQLYINKSSTYFKSLKINSFIKHKIEFLSNSTLILNLMSNVPFRGEHDRPKNRANQPKPIRPKAIG